MAGQFYAGTEWLALIRALNMAHWRVSDKNVHIIVVGAMRPPGDIPPERIDYLGWKAQDEALRILSDCHILYCPYPSDAELAETARLSFPSKLTLYLAAGRPVLFHGPSFSSPARYLAEHGAGLCIDSKLPSAIYNGLVRLVEDTTLYRRIAHRGQAAFQRDFTLDVMRDRFFEFLGMPNSIVAEDEESGRVCEAIYLSDVRALMPQRAKRAVKSARSVLKNMVRRLPYVRRLSRYIAELEAHQRRLTEELESLRATRSQTAANSRLISGTLDDGY
jgi:hypothetical protein